MGKIKNAYKTQTERRKGRKNKEDLRIDGWIILNDFLNNRLKMCELNYFGCDGLFQNCNTF
jgi:hypothetical protein